MEIIAHRGLWYQENEKNTLESLLKAYKNGFGVETDVRDFNGEIVISHDMLTANETRIIRLEDFIREIKDNSHTLAINIKSDGIGEYVNRVMDEYHYEKYFMFDMSIPQMVNYCKNNYRYYFRLSEYEPFTENSDLIDGSCGFFMDSFNGIWYKNEDLQNLLDKYQKPFCFISPELHGRNNYLEFWEQLKKSNTQKLSILCTDLPEKARDFFSSF